MKPIALLLPEGANIEELVNVFAPDLDIDYLKYLIHYVLSKQTTGNKKHPPKDYVSISSQKLLVSNPKHKKHIEFLCSKEANLLHRRPYSEGKCFSYNITPQHKNKPLKVDFLKVGKLASKIVESETKFPTSLNSSSKYFYLKKMFNSNDLNIDLNLAVDHCNSRFKEHQDYKKYVTEMTKIVELYNGEYKVYYKKKKDGRLHTNITSLPKVYRQFITYKNEPLVEVDLSNSIIYFLAVIVKHSSIEDNILEDDIMAHIPLLYMFVKSLRSIENIEVELLWKLATNGEFYNSFIEDFDKIFSFEDYKKIFEKDNDKPYTGDIKQKKKVAKKQVLSMIFAKPNSYKNIQTIFCSKFPKLLESINDFKINNGHKKMSHLLLQLESLVMLGVVGKDYNRKHYKKAPTLTLHDCLITTLDYGKELLESMQMSFKNLFGQAPVMVSKEW
ncbi:MAG: hypothetical protein J0L86_15045 [Flavobacteriales bacterium]|nr:hypothetical protein [Flavobacteriales bacterium]